MASQKKLTIIGAGSSYSPELASGLLARRERLRFEEIRLYDIDADKLAATGSFFRRLLAAEGYDCDVKISFDLKEAVSDADFIITQIRVGQLPARILDEKIPLRHGLIGQETTGIGGMMNAFRTIAAMEDIARAVEMAAPDAWLINFTNPAGIITEYLLKKTKVRAIGLCNIPLGTADGIAKLFHVTRDDIRFDYTGLNHLGFIKEVYCKGRPCFADLLKASYQGMIPANMQNDEHALELIRLLSAIPSPYLGYFFFTREKRKALREAKQTRGEECVAVEKELMAYYRDENNTAIPDMLAKRGGHLYSEAAISLIESLVTGDGAVHVINVQNQGVVPFLKEDDVVECSCRVDADGYTRVPVAVPVGEAERGIISAVKAYERLTVEAACSGSAELARQALACHPMIDSLTAARAALDEMLEANRRYLPQFFRQS